MTKLPVAVIINNDPQERAANVKALEGQYEVWEFSDRNSFLTRLGINPGDPLPVLQKHMRNGALKKNPISFVATNYGYTPIIGVQLSKLLQGTGVGRIIATGNRYLDDELVKQEAGSPYIVYAPNATPENLLELAQQAIDLAQQEKKMMEGRNVSAAPAGREIS